MPVLFPNTADMIDTSPIAPGTYKAKVVECLSQLSKSSGNPMIVPKLHIEVDGKTRVRNAYLVISGPGSGGFDGILRACGFVDTADKAKAGTLTEGFDSDRLVNAELRVVIEPDKDQNGNLSDRIRSFLPL
jgi:hypothetical protein